MEALSTAQSLKYGVIELKSLLGPKESRMESQYVVKKEEAFQAFLVDWNVNCSLQGFDKNQQKISEVVQNWQSRCCVYKLNAANMIQIRQRQQIDKFTVNSSDCLTDRKARAIEVALDFTSQASITHCTHDTDEKWWTSVKPLDGNFRVKNKDTDVRKITLRLNQSLEIVSEKTGIKNQFPLNPLFTSYKVNRDVEKEPDEGSEEI